MGRGTYNLAPAPYLLDTGTLVLMLHLFERAVSHNNIYSYKINENKCMNIFGVFILLCLFLFIPFGFLYVVLIVITVCLINL